MPSAYTQSAEFIGRVVRDLVEVAAEGTTVIDARGASTISVRSSSTEGITVEECDADGELLDGGEDVAADAITAAGAVVGWPYYLVTAGAAACTVGVV